MPVALGNKRWGENGCIDKDVVGWDTNDVVQKEEHDAALATTSFNINSGYVIDVTFYRSLVKLTLRLLTYIEANHFWLNPHLLYITRIVKY